MRYSSDEDLLNMLKNLGFRKTESRRRAAWAVATAGSGASLEELVKLALKSQAATEPIPQQAPPSPPPEPRSLVRIPEIVEEYEEEEYDVRRETDERYDDEDSDDAPPPAPRPRRHKSRPARSQPQSAAVALPFAGNGTYYVTVVSCQCGHVGEHSHPTTRYPHLADAAYGYDVGGRPQLTLGGNRTRSVCPTPASKPKDSSLDWLSWHMALMCAAGVIVLRWLNII